MHTWGSYCVEMPLLFLINVVIFHSYLSHYFNIRQEFVVKDLCCVSEIFCKCISVFSCVILNICLLFLFFVANPKCEKVGCGKWKSPMIDNPKYKGKWRPPLIDNPSYKVCTAHSLLLFFTSKACNFAYIEIAHILKIYFVRSLTQSENYFSANKNTIN